MKQLLPIIILLLFLPAITPGQLLLKEDAFNLETPAPLKGLGGNSVTDIVIDRQGILWLGTGAGLSKSSDNGATWVTFNNLHGLGKGGVSALYLSGDTIWVATGFDTLTKATGREDAGGGLSYSIDGGLTWNWVKQPLTTNIRNITFDITMLKSSLWIVSWGGGVARSNDMGQTWENVAPDTNIFDVVLNLNHRGFSAITVADTLWIGTAGGINKSIDGGATWQNFRHQNQQFPISGNFVVALANQWFDNKNILWAATWVAEDTTEFYGVSKTENGGRTWSTYLTGEKAHNFAFDGANVFAATDNGLAKSEDGGTNWYFYPPIVDDVSGEKVYTTEVYSAAVARDGTLWVGTGDGLARTRTNGYNWTITRAFSATGQANEKRTYAYPNPFSPLRHNQMNGTGHVRFQYNTRGPAGVSIKVYDFAMDLVKHVENTTRPTAGDWSAVWDGTNDNGIAVANGVYFYKVEIDGDGTFWGKVMIVD